MRDIIQRTTKAKTIRRERRRTGATLLAVLLCAAVFLCAVLPAAAESPDPPPYYAIRGATVVTGTGETLEGATVVIADGLIEAVGSVVAVPDDAWVVEAEGMYVYPGLIDAMSTLAQGQDDEDDERPAGPGRGGPPGGRGNQPEIRGPEDRPGTTPWVCAADQLTAEDPRIESWREAGFTSTLTAPAEGYFPGQASFINLGGKEPRDMVVEATAAHGINWQGRGGFRAYPGSLMGRIAYVKQVFSDVRHYAAANELYEASPAGLHRPTYDRSLEPLRQALDAGMPFLLPAQLGRHIDRALELARENELRPILYGGHGAYERIDALQASGVPVLVSLDWPEADRDRDPQADTPIRTHYHRRMAPQTPKLLHDAGIPFAFYSDGLSSASEVLEKVRQAVDAGLPPDAALDALTLGAARILGVDDRLGSIEAGKIANLVVASGEPWAEGAEIEAVFVDGRKYQEYESSEPTEPPASDVSGTWELTMTTPRGTSELTLELKMADDGKVSGEMTGRRGTRSIEKGRMSGDRLSFKTTQTMGPRTMEASFSLLVEGEEIEGSMSAGPMSMDLAGKRTAAAEPASGGGDGGEEPAVTIAELEEAMDAFWGTVEEHDLLAITNARIYTLAGDSEASSIIENGTVVVEGGKIRAVGKDVKIPGKATVIDAGGGSLIPGIIDAHSHIAIEGGGNEGTLAVTSMVTIQDVINPDDIAIYRALAGGVTTVNVLHGSANPIGGGNAVLKLRWGRDADGMRFQGAPPGIKFALGENPKRSRSFGAGVPQRYPATRMGVMDVIRQALREAREYQEAWEEHEAAVQAGEKRIPPRVDLKLQRLAEILSGERLVHSHCYRADEILQLLRLAEEFGFRVATLQHVLEGYKVANEIAAHGAGASTFSDWWGYKVEAYDAIPHNAALMTERGIVVSINSDSDEEMRHLNQEAAKTMKWGGLSEIEALKLVTLNPAKQLGIDDRVGSIEVGKDADLVLYDGTPLSVFSVVQKTFVDGDVYFDVAADRARQTTIDAVKAKLDPDEGDDEGGSGDSEPASRTIARHRNDPTWYEPAYSCEEDH